MIFCWLAGAAEVLVSEPGWHAVSDSINAAINRVASFTGLFGVITNLALGGAEFQYVFCMDACAIYLIIVKLQHLSNFLNQITLPVVQLQIG